MSTLYSIPGIYNALDSFPPLGFGMVPGGSATNNAQALQAVINAAQLLPNGGLVLIPSVGESGATGDYSIAAPGGSGTSIITMTATAAQPLLICGTGDGTTLLIETDDCTLFDITLNNGLTFQDLKIVYNQQPGTPLTGTCFSLKGGQDCTFSRITVQDCQFPFYLSSGTVGGALVQGYLFQSSIIYTDAYPHQSLTAINIDNCAQMMIDQCFLSFAGPAALSTQTGIAVSQSSWLRVTQTEIQNFYIGMVLGVGNQSAKGTMVTNCHFIVALGGIGISLQRGVSDVKFIGCRVENESPGTAQNIVVDPGTAGNQSIDTVIFDSCTSTGSSDYGIQISGGQTIQVLGGTYSGNITAGIAVTGPAAEIQIDGVSCLGQGGGGLSASQRYGIFIIDGSDIQVVNANCSYNGASDTVRGIGIYVLGATVSGIQIIGATCNGSSGSFQDYGISILDIASDIIVAGCTCTGNLEWGLQLFQVINCTIESSDLYGNLVGGIILSGGDTNSQNIYIRNCNISGYSTIDDAITFSGTLLNVAVTNCAGYNDLGHVIASTVSAFPGVGVTFNGTYFGYYGPTALYTTATGTGNVHINGNNTHLSSGGFTLGIGETTSIGSTPSHFLLVGR